MTSARTDQGSQPPSNTQANKAIEVNGPQANASICHSPTSFIEPLHKLYKERIIRIYLSWKCPTGEEIKGKSENVTGLSQMTKVENLVE
jgi:hypothetical protein